jgi:hypothetical protein
MKTINFQELKVDELSIINGGVSIWTVFIDIFTGTPVDLLS